MSFDIEQFKSNFNEQEWKIIMNNMKKKITVSKDPSENARIKFLRAQNRVLRITYGEYYLKMVVNMPLSFWTRVSMSFYYIKKFEMKKNERFLFKTLSTWLAAKSIWEEKYLSKILN